MKQSLLLSLITAILALLTVFQLLLILGLPLGHAAWGGQNEVLPTGYRVASAASILIYGAILWIARRRIDKPDRKGFRIAAWLLFAFFCVGVLLNTVTSSAIEHIWVPVNLILAWAFFLLARGKKQKDSQAL
jgi:hypothetical protein